MSSEEFSVYQFFEDDQYERVLSFVSCEDACKRAHALCHTVGAQIGTTQRVIITNGGDETVFQWQYGLGVTWPKGTSNS